MSDKKVVVVLVLNLKVSSLIFAIGLPQVVKYKPFGHYHAHYDSSKKSDYPEGTRCCHYDLAKAPMGKCRICR